MIYLIYAALFTISVVTTPKQTEFTYSDQWFDAEAESCEGFVDQNRDVAPFNNPIFYPAGEECF